MFTNETRTINGINVTLLTVDACHNTATYYARGPFKDYYIRRTSSHQYIIETYEECWMDEANSLEEACQILLDWETGNAPW